MKKNLLYGVFAKMHFDPETYILKILSLMLTLTKNNFKYRILSFK